MRKQPLATGLAPVAWVPLGGFAAITVAFHLAIAGRYGWMRDEMYYVEAGKHLSGGYVEFPMMVALLANLQRFLFGTSLFAIHVLPPFAGAGIIIVTGLMAREMGGGKVAQTLAGLAILVAPAFVGVDSLFTMDAFDELWWALAAYMLIRLLATYDPRRQPYPKQDMRRRNLWLLFGLVCGLGLLTKLTILAFGFAIVVALLLSVARREFRTPWPYVGGLIAFAFLIPYVIWQIDNDWATVAFWHTYSHGEGPAQFITEVLLLMQPLAIPLWIVGLWRLLRDRDLRPYRTLGWVWLILLILYLGGGHSKSYFLVPAFPPLFAAGSIVVENLSFRRPKMHIVALTATGLIVGGILLAPVVAPILPPKTLASLDSKPIQPVADKFGWPQLVSTFARVTRSLPASQRSQATILAGNYGEASALILLGKSYHLPQVISPDNTYWFWGRGVIPKGPVIAIDMDSTILRRDFGSVTKAATIPSEDGIQNEEVGRTVWVCRELKYPWSTLWKQFQNFS